MAQVMADNLLLADAHEGIGAFIQKRKPRGNRTLKPRINFVTLGVVDMVAMRAFYERLGLVASSASNPDVRSSTPMALCWPCSAIMRLRKTQALRQARCPNFAVSAWRGMRQRGRS